MTTVPDRNAKIAKLKALFKKLLMFALVMGVVCLVLFFWCTARYTSTAHTDRFTKLTAINGASMYYDWNRDRNARNGFQSLKTVPANAACSPTTGSGLSATNGTVLPSSHSSSRPREPVEGTEPLQMARL